MRLRTLASLLIFVTIFSTDLFNLARAQRMSSRPVVAKKSTGIPTPQEVLGFTPGDDRKLASWNQVLEYFDRLDKASDRVRFEALGKTTMDRPFAMATISAPENLARLEEYRKIQDLLADPRKLGPNPAQKAAQLIAQGKTIVLITCGIHSTEVGSTLSSMLIAYRLASSDDPEIKNILKNTIILLVPSLNPDGVDIVKDWYDKTLGMPYEGTEPPELYHKYTGHDNNRDWYAFTQVETRITVDKIHNVWHPQIVHDIHQQGSFGSRLFLPPYMAPVEPNVPKEIVEGYTELGNWMAKEMRAQGFVGITTNSTYDAWSPSRAYSHYHGGVRILSETASARIASPITVKFDDLTSREGYDPRKETANFGPLWHGGEWKLRDITNTMTTCAFFLLKHASENREQWLRRFYEIGKEAVRPARKGEAIGFQLHITPARSAEWKGAEALLQIMSTAGVEFERGFIPGFEVPSEIAIINTSQPYGAFARALLDPQLYPDLRDSSGRPIPPYDVTAHSLAMLMGVKATRVYKLPKMGRAIVENAATELERSSERIGLYQPLPPSMDEGWTRWILERERQKVTSLRAISVRGGNLGSRYDIVIIPDQSARTLLNGYAKGAMPPDLTGGLAQDGVNALRQFGDDGGTLVCLNRASEFALEQFKLPIKNVVSGLPRTEF